VIYPYSLNLSFFIKAENQAKKQNFVSYLLAKKLKSPESLLIQGFPLLLSLPLLRGKRVFYMNFITFFFYANIL